MPIKPLFQLFLVFSCALSMAQNAKITIQKFESATPYTNLDLNNDSEDFQFAIVTDRTGGHRPGVFMDGVNKLNLLQPEFVMSVGDLIEGYTEDRSTLEAEWKEFDGFVNQLEMPFFYVPGNHDITNEVMEKLWIEKFGTTYYHFVYKDVLFLCLNSEDMTRGAGRGTISDAQYEYVKKTLDDNADVRWTLVFLHQPLWVQKNPERWPDVEKLLNERKHNVFAGHYHHYVAADRNNGKYIMLGTTGGGSGLRGPQLGEFDHFMWVTMKGSGPILANIALNGVFDENLYTAESEERVEAIEDMQVIQIEPLVVESVNDFTSRAVRVKLTNDLDFPITVKLKERFNWDLIGKVDRNEITINPNSVEFAELDLFRRNAEGGLGETKPFVLESMVSFKTAQGTEIEIPGRYSIQPLKPYTLPKDAAKAIDGSLADWLSLDHVFQAEEKNGNQVDVGVTTDDTYLYIAAKVKDDEVMTTGKGAPWNQDYVGFALNAEPLEKSAMSVGKHWYENEMYFIASPEKEGAASVHWPKDKLPEGSEWKCVVTEGGYTFEARIPLSYMVSKQGEDWKSFRLNLMTGDHDTDREEVRTYWQNDWRGEENVIGSGMFFRE